MNWIDGIGFLASAAVLATFCMKRMIALRIVALITYYSRDMDIWITCIPYSHFT
jgi:hypothetical protein